MWYFWSGSIFVSLCRWCVFVSCGHPVIVLNSAFCVAWSLLMFVEDAELTVIDEPYSRVVGTTARSIIIDMSMDLFVLCVEWVCDIFVVVSLCVECDCGVVYECFFRNHVWHIECLPEYVCGVFVSVFVKPCMAYWMSPRVCVWCVCECFCETMYVLLNVSQSMCVVCLWVFLWNHVWPIECLPEYVCGVFVSVFVKPCMAY